MRLAHGLIRSLLGFSLVCLVGCDEGDDDNDKEGTSGMTSGDASSGEDGSSTSEPEPQPEPPAWAVGRDGTMLRIDRSGASTYPLDEDGTLRAIACHGDQVAWTVGDRGVALYTLDAGETWSSAPLGLDQDLHAVAISGSHVIYVAGEDGALALSSNAGASFEEIAAPDVDFTAVAVEDDGSGAVLVTTAGSVWRHEVNETSLALVHTTDRPLHGVAVGHGTSTVVAVGERGLWLQSDDLGQTWTELSVPSTRDLFAVSVASDLDLTIAVGEAGVVVRHEADAFAVTELLDDQSLRALHVSGTGHTIAVGDGGAAFVSRDLTDPLQPLPLDASADLLGVDEISLHGHW